MKNECIVLIHSIKYQQLCKFQVLAFSQFPLRNNKNANIYIIRHGQVYKART